MKYLVYGRNGKDCEWCVDEFVNEELAVAYCKKANKILRSYKAHTECRYSVINNKEMFKKMSELDPQFQIDRDGVKYVVMVSVEVFD